VKEERHAEMCLVTAAVKDYLKCWLADEHWDNPVYGDYNDSLGYMFDRRFAREIWLRPYVCAMLLKQYGRLYAAPGIIDGRVLPALTASEVFNISTYQSNLVFDDKIKNETISNVNQFISSFVTFDVAVQMLQRLDLPEDKVLDCVSVLNECNKDVYKGQFIDLNVLVTRSASALLAMPEQEYVKLYFDRCRRIGGTTVDTCAFWAYTLSGKDDPEELGKLRELFWRWGQLMQMANDLSDYTVFINQKDFVRYTDLRAGKITYPFYLILVSMPKEKALSFLNSMGTYDDETLDRFFRRYLYMDSPIIKRVFSQMHSLWIPCRQLIRELNLNTKYFHFMFENAFLTKFSRCFFSNQLIKTVRK
jgi:hypothetical protein